MTIYKTLEALLDEGVFVNMTLKAQKLVTTCFDGIGGLGEVNDLEVREYLTEPQIKYIRDTAKRYLPNEVRKG